MSVILDIEWKVVYADGYIKNRVCDKYTSSVLKMNTYQENNGSR